MKKVIDYLLSNDLAEIPKRGRKELKSIVIDKPGGVNIYVASSVGALFGRKASMVRRPALIRVLPGRMHVVF